MNEVWVVTSELQYWDDSSFRVVAAFSSEGRAKEFVQMRLTAWRKAEAMLDDCSLLASRPRPSLESVFGGWSKLEEVLANETKRAASEGDPGYEGESYEETDGTHELKIKRVDLDRSWAR